MICLGFKGGIGTASRQLSDRAGGFTVGVLVQCNFGLRRLLRIAGVPVGQEITEPRDVLRGTRPRLGARGGALPAAATGPDEGAGVDHRGGRDRRAAAAAPAPPGGPPRRARHRPDGRDRGRGLGRPLHRLFHRAAPERRARTASGRCRCWATTRIDPVYEATVQATEEAIINAMLAAKTMTRRRRLSWCPALPHDRLQEVLRKYGRLGQRQVSEP